MVVGVDVCFYFFSCFRAGNAWSMDVDGRSSGKVEDEIYNFYLLHHHMWLECRDIEGERWDVD